MKKAVCVLLIILLLCGSACASVAVNLTRSFLLSEDWELISGTDDYSSIVALGDTRLFAARGAGSGLICFMDETGLPATDEIYTDVSLSGLSFIVAANERYGALNMKLGLSIPVEYTYLTGAGATDFLALKTELWDDVADMLYLITSEGLGEPTGVMSLYAPEAGFSSELTPVEDAKSGYFGYIGTDGRYSIEPRFTSACGFVDGMAAAGTDGRVGVINTMGDYLISPAYLSVSVGTDMIVCVDEERVMLYARDSEGCAPVCRVLSADAALCGSYAAVYTDADVSVYNSNAEVIARFGADALILEGMRDEFLVSDGEGMTLYTKDGAKAFGAYAFIQPLCEYESETYYKVFSETDGGYTLGVIDGRGNTVLESVFTQIKSPAEGVLAAEDAECAYVYRLTDGIALNVFTLAY